MLVGDEMVGKDDLNFDFVDFLFVGFSFSSKRLIEEDHLFNDIRRRV